jgi:hypothetical protein
MISGLNLSNVSKITSTPPISPHHLPVCFRPLMPGSRFHPLFLVLALLFAHAALANKPWTFLCEKSDCSNGNCTGGQCSIINTASSSPSAAISLDTHVTVEFTTLDAVTDAEATATAEKMCQAIFKTGLASAPPSPGAASASGGAQAPAASGAAAAPPPAIPSGLRPTSHQRRGIDVSWISGPPTSRIHVHEAKATSAIHR